MHAGADGPSPCPGTLKLTFFWWPGHSQFKSKMTHEYTRRISKYRWLELSEQLRICVVGGRCAEFVFQLVSWRLNVVNDTMCGMMFFYILLLSFCEAKVRRTKRNGWLMACTILHCVRRAEPGRCHWCDF